MSLFLTDRLVACDDRWDRQPFSMEEGALPVPALTVTEHNLIFADYQGAKALDHDDGSSFFFDHHNVIYMGWGQKTFEPSPGNKTASDSLILFTSSVLTEHGGEASADFAERFINNTIVFTPGQANYGKVDTEAQISSGMMQLRENRFFTDGAELKLAVGGNGTKDLAELQALGAEVGSTIVKTLPSDAWIVAAAKGLLLMPSKRLKTDHVAADDADIHATSLSPDLPLKNDDNEALLADFWVSSTGDDEAAGTHEAPFLTLSRAVMAVRELPRPLAQTVTVHVAGGDYRLNETLTLHGAADSGSSTAARVDYVAEGGR